MRANRKIVPRNYDKKVEKGNDVPKGEKPMAGDVTVDDTTGRMYIQGKTSNKKIAVTIGGKYGMYKISNNFCTNKYKQ